MADWLRRLAPLLIALPVFGFFLLLLTYAVNVPWLDDVESFVGFLNEYRRAPDLSGKLYWLIKPNNEHRILFAKLTTLGLFGLTGELNFRWLILVAFACLVGLLGLFALIFRQFRLPWLYFLPVSLVMFQPQHYLTSVWAITGLQHQAVALLVLGGLYLLSVPEGRGRFVPALGLQVLASLSMSNGLFGWVAGAGVLLLQRRYVPLAVWLLIGVGVIAFYFHDFQSPQGNESSVSFFLRHPHLVFFGFFTFTGALFDFFPDANILPRSILPTLFGMVLIGLLAFLGLRMVQFRPLGVVGRDASARRIRYFFVGFYTFLLVNAVVVAFLRPRFGYNVMLVSNYMLYPVLWFIALYLHGLYELPVHRVHLRQLPRRLHPWVTAGLGLGVGIWLIAHVRHLPRVAERRQMLLAYAFDQKHNDVGLGAHRNSFFGNYIEKQMTDAVRAGYYRYPEGFYTPYEPALLAPPPPVSAGFDVTATESAGIFNLETVGLSLPEGVKNACLIARSDRQTYLFPAENLFRPGPFFLGRTVPALQAEMFRYWLPPGTYRIGVLLTPDVAQPIRYSDRRITVR